MLKSSILMDFESSISNIYKKLLESLYFYFLFFIIQYIQMNIKSTLILLSSGSTCKKYYWKA